MIGGISRGGRAALEIAASGDLSISGVVAVPGFFRLVPENTKGYKNLPVYLRFGAESDLAQEGLDKTSSELKKCGAIVDGKLVENGKHIFKVNWVEVAKWKETFKANE